MKVLQIGPYPPPHGGVQTNLVAIRRLLLRRNISCWVINITRHRKSEGGGIYYPKSALELFRLLVHLKYDIVHLHFGGDLTLRILVLALICCAKPHSKAIMTFHSGGYPSSKKGRAARSWGLRAFVLRRFDRIIGVNREIIEFLHRLGVRPERARLIFPHSLSYDGSDDPDVLPNSLRDFFSSHSPVLITVGLLEHEYDLPLQIEVLGLVRENFPMAGLVIVGAGSLEEDLKDRIRKTSYADHIELCGDLPHPATLRAIWQSDLMLRTTHYDGDAISVRESLHLGTPVIATDTGMRPSGVLQIPIRDLEALRRTIETFLRGPRTREPRRESSDQNIEAVLNLYDELTSGE